MPFYVYVYFFILSVCIAFNFISHIKKITSHEPKNWLKRGSFLNEQTTCKELDSFTPPIKIS